MLVQDFLHESSRMYPDKVALVCAGERLTYDQIEPQANRLALALRQHGVQRGDRVAIFLDNCVEAVVAPFAILKAGGVFVMVNHTTKPEKLTFILNNCQAVGLLADERFADQGQLHLVLARVASLKLAIVCGRSVTAARQLDSRRLDYAALQAAFPPTRPAPLNRRARGPWQRAFVRNLQKSASLSTADDIKVCRQPTYLSDLWPNLNHSRRMF